MDLAESSSLLERARRGESEALEAIFERSAGKLLALIRLRLGRGLRRHLESRDILQTAMMKAVGNLEHLEASGTSSFMGWLARIAENEIRDQAAYYGRRRRDAALNVALEAHPGVAETLRADVRSASSRLVWSEEAERLEKALESLSEEHREVIVLRRLEELAYAEIAERLGRSPDACRMLFARAMTALVAAMGAVPV